MSTLNESLDTYIEALLFHKGGAMEVKDIAQVLQVEEGAVTEALELLQSKLEGRGLVLIHKGTDWMLGTHPHTARIVERVIKADLEKKLSKAALETLSIILYRSPLSRSEIDYIRGVNSSFILRNLVMRGLIERSLDKKKNTNIYTPTFDTLAYLGVSEVTELPDFEQVNTEIKNRTSVEEKDESE